MVGSREVVRKERKQGSCGEARYLLKIVNFLSRKD